MPLQVRVCVAQLCAQVIRVCACVIRLDTRVARSCTCIAQLAAHCGQLFALRVDQTLVVRVRVVQLGRQARNVRLEARHGILRRRLAQRIVLQLLLRGGRGTLCCLDACLEPIDLAFLLRDD